MSIPLISNIGFTEVNSAGNLNNKAGTSKSKLPVQFFKLTDNITGNLTLDNNTAHKKIILDTNGNTIINDTGSPLTTNSDVTLELKGTGNIQSELKQFTDEETSTGFTGTSTITEANDSTMGVSTGDTVTQHSIVTNTSAFNPPRSADFPAVAGSSPRPGFRPLSITLNGVTYNSFTSEFRQVMIDSTRSGGAWNGATIVSGGFTATFGSNGTAKTTTGNNGDQGNQAVGDILFQTGYDNSVGWLVGGRVQSFEGDNSEVTGYGPVSLINPGTISNYQIGQTDPDRIFTFTNNLDINVTLTGNDPYDNTVVSGSGGTAVVSVTNSTDGSFSLTGTISGSNGSGEPFALVSVNNGTGSLNTSDYTGKFSARAF